LIDRFIIYLRFGCAHIATGSENKVMPLDLIDLRSLREPSYIFVTAVVVAPRMVGTRDLFDVIGVEHTQLAWLHPPEFPSVDEQHLITPLTVAVTRSSLRDEPQSDRDTGVEEQLVRHRHDAVHQPCLDEFAADLAFTAALRRQRPVGEHEACRAVGGEVMNEVLDPREVRVTWGRCAVLPAGIITEFRIPPVRDVEWRVRDYVVSAEILVEILGERVRRV